MNPTPEQMRIAIAEACGWTAREDEDGFWRAVEPIHGMRPDKWVSERNVWQAGIPDYLNDLNAMHEAEKVLTPHQLEWFEEHLRRIVHKATTDADWAENVGPTAATKFWHATAAQRAEALCRVVKPELFA